MTKQEAIQLIEKKEFTIKELFEVYEVKNIDGLEAYLEIRFDKIDINNEYLVNSFKFIFETRESENFNPLEEKYRYYAMILPGLFGIDPDNMQILVAGLGLFKAVLMLDKILQEKEEIKYFNNLYKEYVNEMYSIGRTANKYVKLLDNTLKDFLQKNNKESLSEVVKDFINAKDSLLKKAE
jgi:hypothetical protein